MGAKAALALADAELWSPALEASLQDLGFSVSFAFELHELFEASRTETATLLILAKRNPRFVVQACRAMRGLQDVPIFVIMPEESDLIPVLDADDAVVARVDPGVFAARARALLRRVHRSTRGSVIAIRDLEIDLDTCQVTMGGRIIALTPTVFRLLAILIQSAGRVLDARTLLSAVHEHDYSDRDAQSLVKVHIANIRRKLNDSHTDSPYILCVRGFGYMLERRFEPREGDPLAPLIKTGAS